MAGEDYSSNKLAIEEKFRLKLPLIIEFISGQLFENLSLKFFMTTSSNQCSLNITNVFFDLISTYRSDSKEYTCYIYFKTTLDFISYKGIICHFDNDLNIRKFCYRISFGSLGFKNRLCMENTKHFNGNYNRKLYLQTFKSLSINLIEDLNTAIHQEDHEFDKYLSKIFTINYTKPEFYSELFNYLPVIDLNDTKKTAYFLNKLHERHSHKDKVLKRSFELLEMYNF